MALSVKLKNVPMPLCVIVLFVFGLLVVPVFVVLTFQSK